jgi:hypothetical protein
VSDSDAARVVVCRQILVARGDRRSRYIPKEFFPVAGRPGSSLLARLRQAPSGYPAAVS